MSLSKESCVFLSWWYSIVFFVMSLFILLACFQKDKIYSIQIENQIISFKSSEACLKIAKKLNKSCIISEGQISE